MDAFKTLGMEGMAVWSLAAVCLSVSAPEYLLIFVICLIFVCIFVSLDCKTFT